MDSQALEEIPTGSDVSLSMERANVLATYLFPALVGVVAIPFVLLHGWAPLREGVMAAFTTWYLIPAFAALIVAHELLHAIGFLLFARVPRRSIHFGVDRKTLTPYAGCRVPVTARAYRGAIFLPCLVLGIAPALVGIGTGDGLLAVIGALMIAAAGGDVIVIWVIRKVPAGASVADHPSRVGCVLVEDAAEGAVAVG